MSADSLANATQVNDESTKSYVFTLDSFLSERVRTHRCYKIEQNASTLPFKEVFDNVGWTMHSIPTRGDGACGLHAVFGESSSQNDLVKEDARNFAADMFAHGPQALVDRGATAQHIETISLTLWYDFMLPCLQNLPNTEGQIFRNIASHLQPELVEECKQHMLATEQ